MKELTTYLLETLACSGVLLAVYSILLEQRVKFRWCRLYLLFSSFAAAVIPLLSIPVWAGKVIIIPAAPLAELPEAQIETAALPEPSAITSTGICMLAYGIGLSLMLGLLIWQLTRIFSLRRHAEITRMRSFSLARTSREIASFSFFRTIYVWGKTPEADLETILLHESSHIRHRHSIERMLMECLKAILWWNPFVWISSRRLTEVEEYEADSDVLAADHEISAYINTIFKQLFGYSPEIANGLRDSLTKKRLKMMTTQTPGRYALLRLAGIIPAVIGLLFAFSFTTRAAEIRIAETEETAPKYIYLLNGKETTIRELNTLNPDCFKTILSLNGKEAFEQYGQYETADFVHVFITDGKPKTGKKVTLKGRVLFENGQPAANCRVAAVADFRTVPIDKEDEKRFTILTDDAGYYTLKAGAKGWIAAYYTQTIHGQNYNSEGADPYSIDITLQLPDSAKWESVTRPDGSVVLTDRPKPEVEAGNDSGSPKNAIVRQAPNTCQVTLKISCMIKNGNNISFEPASGAIVATNDSTLGAVTDNQGYVRFVAPQNSILEVKQPDYNAVSIDIGARKEFNDVVLLSPEDGIKPERTKLELGIPDESGVMQTPLYLIDGIERPIDSISQNDINTIEVIKDASSLQRYGDRGRHGVVLITTRRQAMLEQEEKQAAVEEEKEEPFLIAETMPSFQDGDLRTFQAWVQTNLRYPQEALKANLAGRVVCSFVIEKDGTLTDFQLLQSPDISFSREAKRVVESSPRWAPGCKDGIPVRVRYTFPVDFRIMNDTPEVTHAVMTDQGSIQSASGEKDEPFLIAEVMPTFQGGNLNVFRQWVQTNLRYPQEALKANLAGRVVIQFIIEKDGRVNPGKILQSPGKPLSEEVLRVLRKSPNWTPGLQQGEIVRVLFTLPIDFAVSNQKNINLGDTVSTVRSNINPILAVGFQN